MRLKTLEMQGFKSFPEKTVLSFDHGVTAVVGPNGSGKSNISDAMRWVLGEISSKSIRGTKMEDVIFGGTDNRRPMAFCEVSLTIDNTDPENRMAIEYDEVTVTRRYYRNGDSEYFINRKPVRLRDITELFMNTGIGRSGYSIVSQGKAAEIISQKSDERRIIFEEAAGIAKYRHKKNDAEKKLNEVEDNLVRIGDILGELEGRVGPLEKESEKARKYLDLYEKKKNSEVALSIFDISDIKNKKEKLDFDFNISARELEAADAEITSLENKAERLYEQVQKDKLRYEELNRLTREANEERFGYESAGKVFENEIQHIKEIRFANEEKLKSLDEELTAAKSKAELLATDCEAKKDLLVSTVAENEETAAKIAETDALIDGVSQEIDSLLDSIADANDELVNAKIELSTLEVSDKSGDEKRSSLIEESNELTENHNRLLDRIAKADETISAYNESVASLNKTLEAMKAEEGGIAKAIADLSEALNTATVELHSKEHRVETLERMEAQLDGYSQSVRRVMNAVSEKRLGGIHGPVSKIITTDPGYSAAIESALGASMQNIVVENESDAKKAIHFLRDNRAGRATFYPVSTVKPSYLNLKEFDFTEYKGYIAQAHELAETTDKFRGVVDYLLCRTVVFDNLDNATAMARACGFKIRCVTLDGQLINTGGSFTGGSAVRESGMLTRQNDISKLNREIEAHKEELVRITRERAEREKELKNKQNELSDISARASLFASLISAENAQKGILATQAEADRERLDTLAAAITGIDEDITRAKQTYIAVKERIEVLNAELLETNKKQDERVAYRRELSISQDELRRLANTLLIRIAEQRKDVEVAEAALALENERIAALESSVAASNLAIENANQRLDEFTAKIESGEGAAKHIAERIAAYEKEIEEISARNLENEKLDSDLREEQKSLTHRRETLFRQYTKLESDIASISTEQQKLTDHLWEEYELTYSTALELNLPAVTAENRKSVYATVSELRTKIRQMGSVNVNAIEEYNDVKTRYDFMKVQYDDLTGSRTELGGVIFKLEKEMRERFKGVFEAINANFKVVFTELFGGGSANISLTDPDNVLTSGIEIEVAPPGKIIKNLSLLSGGEQSFVAIALFFAILKVNPTPFCVLDEIEAALDEVNVARFAEYCRKYSERTQFICITHRRGTMESADVLYGVTMYERGVSKVLSVNVNEVENKIGVKL
ncbi:MAG: chromosome segregation protein SMC [Clostridia bacterium]|nr:chromosome segregation protein SMC [Clostridia bacterium]